MGFYMLPRVTSISLSHKYQEHQNPGIRPRWTAYSIRVWLLTLTVPPSLLSSTRHHRRSCSTRSSMLCCSHSAHYALFNYGKGARPLHLRCSLFGLWVFTSRLLSSPGKVVPGIPSLRSHSLDYGHGRTPTTPTLRPNQTQGPCPRRHLNRQYRSLPIPAALTSILPRSGWLRKMNPI